MNLSTNEKVTCLLSIVSIFIATYAVYISNEAKKTKLTIESIVTKCDKNCSQLFIFNNDEAPCFELELSYDDSLGEAYLMRNFNKSNFFNARFESGVVSFPAMNPVFIPKENGKPAWLGYLGNKDVAYIKFIRDSNKSVKNNIEISCAGYSKSVKVKI